MNINVKDTHHWVAFLDGIAILNIPIFYLEESIDQVDAPYTFGVVGECSTNSVEYDPRVISFKQLLEVFWSRRDSRQVFCQGTDEYKKCLMNFQVIFMYKFELKQNLFLLQLIGNLPEEELEASSLATTLDGYATELCPPKIQNQIDAKVNDIVNKGWPLQLREV
ncbi:hypothetical protein UlMin_004474 [Ulmus minor]